MMFVQQGMPSPSTFGSLNYSSGRAVFSAFQEVFDEFYAQEEWILSCLDQF